MEHTQRDRERKKKKENNKLNSRRSKMRVDANTHKKK